MSQIFYSHARLNRETRTPQILRTLGASLVAHALFLAAVVYVPAVRDTFRLASTLTGIQFVEEDYTKTAIGDRATIINLADNKLFYPAGYFSQTALPAPNDPQLVAEVRPLPTPKPIRIRPKPSPTPAEASPSPETAADAETTAQNEGDKAGTPGGGGASPTPATPPQTAEEAERIAKEANVEKFPTINTKPLTDLLQQGKQMRDAGEIDLTGNLEMDVEGDREDDGRLTNVVVTGAAASNPKLVGLAKDFIAAISDSKLLAALKGTRHLKLHVKLDDKEVAVRVLAEMASEGEATMMSNGYQGLLFIGAQSKKGKEEEAIFKSVQIASEAKQIVLSFNMPRKAAGALLTKLIKKNEATPTNTATPPPG